MKKHIFLIFFLFQIFSLKAQLNTDKLMSVGTNAYHFKDYVLAIQYFNQVIKAKPFLDAPYIMRAGAKIMLEDYYGALDDLNIVIARNEFIPYAYYSRGFIYNKIGKEDLAAQDFTRALVFVPDNSMLIFSRIFAYDKQKKFDEALTDLELMISKFGQKVDLLQEKSRFLLNLNDTISALNVIDTIIKIDSTNSAAWGQKGLIYLVKNESDKALEYYNKAIENGSKFEGDFINRGVLLKEKKDYRGALADYDKAISIVPNDTLALFNRANIRAEIGDLNNALIDLNRLLEIQPNYYEAIYNRSLVNMQLGNFKDVVADISKIIKKYPYFSDAYEIRAMAYEKLGNMKAFWNDKQTLNNLQRNKNKEENNKNNQEIDTKEKVAQTKKSENNWSKFFSTTSIKDADKNLFENNILRGEIQNRNVEIELQNLFVLSPYQKSDIVREVRFFFSLLNEMNRRNQKEMSLRFVNEEVALTDALINYHFKMINDISEKIDKDRKNSDLYFLRGINNALVQDFNSAIEDFSAAILNGADALAYFCRASMRQKQLEVSIAGLIAEQTKNEPQNAIVADKKFSRDYEMIFRDYDKTIELSPDFCFAWFNRANLLCSLKDYKSAISNFSNAIAINPDFAEAYFNRALTYIYIGENEKGIADLSKAGELGIYQAYNLLKKLAK